MTTNPLPATAAWYAKEMDWAIFPLAPRSKIPLKGSKGFKDATRDPQTIEKRWKASPCSNIGCATGDASGLLVIDVDDPESFKVLCRGREIPLSARQTTSPGRMQLFFKMPKGTSIACSASKLAKGVDVRVNGGYTVVPPSIHPDTGRPYDWVEGFELPAVGLADAPGWLLAEIQSPSKESEAPAPLQANGDIPEGQRNDTLFRYGAALRAGGASRKEVLSSIRDRNHARCKPPLDDAELIKIAESAVRYDPMAHLTDMGNADRLVKQHGGSLKYCAPQKKWYVWDGKKWAPDMLKRVELLAKEVVRSIPAEAENLSSDDQRKAIRKWARQSESADRIRAMVRVAQSDLAVAQDAFDTHPWLLNVENGTLDLKTGKLLPHNRDHLITKMAGAAWHSDAACPTFMAFLERVLGGDSELISFIQKVAGLSLIGQARERILVVLHGRGANGKTVLLETLMSVLGDSALSTPAETFLSKKTSSIPNDVARLKGARLVTCRETDSEQRFCSASIKAVTGGDKIAARKGAFDCGNARGEYACTVFQRGHAALIDCNHTGRCKPPAQPCLACAGIRLRYEQRAGAAVERAGNGRGPGAVEYGKRYACPLGNASSLQLGEHSTRTETRRRRPAGHGDDFGSDPFDPFDKDSAILVRVAVIEAVYIGQ